MWKLICIRYCSEILNQSRVDSATQMKQNLLTQKAKHKVYTQHHPKLLLLSIKYGIVIGNSIMTEANLCATEGFSRGKKWLYVVKTNTL